MGIGFGVWLTILGMLGASNLIISRRPDAADVIARFAPYQGWLGAGAAVSGLIYTVLDILGIALLASHPILWITNMAVSLVLLTLGLLLGVGVLKTFIKDPTANAKMDETIKKLAPYQGTLGLAAIGLGIWAVISSILF